VWKQTILQDTTFGKAGMDVFVVNSFSSLFQGVINVAIMVVLVAVGYGSGGGGGPGVPGLGALPTYFGQGLDCLARCPAPPFIYLFCNVLFNLQVVNLLKKSNLVITSLAIAFVVPLSFIAFSLPVPMLERTPFYTDAIKGLALLTVGIILYNTKVETIERLVARVTGNPPKTQPGGEMGM